MGYVRSWEMLEISSVRKTVDPNIVKGMCRRIEKQLACFEATWSQSVSKFHASRQFYQKRIYRNVEWLQTIAL